MKPDGVVTAAMEPMETLDSDPVNEPAPVGGPEPNQVQIPAQGDASQPPAEDTGKGDPQPDQAKETPTAKPNNKTSDEPKTKTANKTSAKTKTGTGPAKTAPGSRPSTAQSRVSNNVSQTNGVAKKTAPAGVKKTPTATPPLKKPTGLAAASTPPKTKMAEKKPAGTTASTNGTKPAAAKKTPTGSAAANGVKSSSSASAKKPPATKPAAAAPSKPSSTASPKPAVSKTTRPSTGSAAPSPRPSTASTTKSSPAAPKAAAPKTSSAAKPSPKPSSSTPSAGKPPAAQGSRNATPVKKDVSKPGTPGAKKAAESPLARVSSTTKSTKPETTKTAPKPEAAKKTPAATKTPSRKPLDAKTPSKDASKTPASKTAAAKNSAPKKAVGSSTPTPVKRAAKPAAAPEPEKEVAAAVAAAAAIATAAAAIASSEGPEPGPVEPTPGPEVAQEPTPEPVREPTPETVPEPVREPTPEPLREPTPEPVREPTPEPVREPTPEPLREPTPEPVREPTPEPLREPTPEPVREPTPEPVREPTPESVRDLTPELAREPTPEPMTQPTPEPVRIVSPEQPAEPDLEYEPVHEPVSHKDLFKFEESTNESVPSLGTTVMSPPCSPPGPVSPVREPQSASSLLDMGLQADPWDRDQVQTLSDFAPQSLVDPMNFQTREEEHEDQDEVQEEKEDLFTASSTAPSAGGFNLLGTSPVDQFSPRQPLASPHEKEEAVEKAEEEINEDDEEDDDEDEEQRRLGHTITDMSVSQPSEDFQVRSSAFGGSAGWHGDDLLSGMDSEDVSSCTSSRQQGVSDLSSTQHTALLEGTQSSDALVDSSLHGNLMGSPNVETLANEEEDEDEEDERVDDMDLSSERVEEHHKVFQQQERDEEEEEEEEDEDVEMHSEGVTESCGNEDEDFNEDERLDNLNRAAAAPPASSSSWGQTNPFSDPWAQPSSLLAASSPSPMSDHGPLESETPTLSPAQARLDCSAPAFDDELEQRRSALQTTTASSDELLAAPAAMAAEEEPEEEAPAHSGSETSTPEELRDYDSSSGVESRSDKQHTPVPAAVQPDMEQDLGIHLEKGDGEEEEAETLPADEVLGTGPPTAPASAPSSASTSGDEASDTEGEMQINDPDGAAAMDESAGGFDSPTPTANLPALDEDEEAGDAAGGDAEEDGGGATPQSANSVASYGFDCTTSNSNAHSVAESCGKSPGIFSLENEEQLPEEAKDPSLIKELTLPPSAAAHAAAHADDLLGRHVDLMPLGQPGLDDHHYMLGGKMAADLDLEEAEPLAPGRHLGAPQSSDGGDSQPPYYSTICDKTDSFLAGDKKTHQDLEEGYRMQAHSQEDNRNQNHTGTTVLIGNGHYLAMVPGNRRPIDPALAAHFARISSPPPLIEASAGSRSGGGGGGGGGEQLRRLELHQEKLREMQHRQEQERQKRQWLEEERLRLEQQKQLEKQRRELLQLQLQQQQQEHRHRRQVLQWQLELEQQYRMQQKQIQQQQQQLRRSPTGLMVSPSSGLCTIYEAMETSDEEDEARGEENRNAQAAGRRPPPPYQGAPQDLQRQLRPVPPQELEWNQKVDMVQQLINQTLVLSGDRDCPPLLLLPVGAGGTLSPLESSMWPSLLPQFSPPAATVTSVSSFSPDSQTSSPPGDWTVVEVETQH